jgi:hypothetical protein
MMMMILRRLVEVVCIHIGTLCMCSSAYVGRRARRLDGGAGSCLMGGRLIGIRVRNRDLEE